MLATLTLNPDYDCHLHGDRDLEKGILEILKATKCNLYALTADQLLKMNGLNEQTIDYQCLKRAIKKGLGCAAPAFLFYDSMVNFHAPSKRARYS